ncbi:MAG: hypothetical protein WA792_10375 [Pseudolabrys sp.]|jgi:hypothetical protein
MKTQLQKTGYAVLVAAVSAAFMLAAASSSEAAKKKAAAVPAAGTMEPLSCLTSGTPVCGVKGGIKFTYANSCYAQRDGAKVSSSKACSGGKKMAKASKKPAKKKK